MTPYNQILTLHLCGYNNTDIAKTAKCARGTVIDVLKRADEHTLVYPPDHHMSDLELHRVLYEPLKRHGQYVMPDMGSVIFSIGIKKNSIAKEWAEYQKKCETAGKKAYSKSAYQGFIRDLADKYSERPYAGSIRITLLKVVRIGEKLCQVLYAELDYAGSCYAIVLEDLKPRTWVNANKQLFRYIGAVPDQYIYIGHLPKSLTAETENLMAFYRVKLENAKAPDFAQWFLDECNAVCETDVSAQTVVSRICEKTNETPMYAFSMFSHADAARVQKKWLRPLVGNEYETLEIKHPTVQMNFHVELEGKYYSVPFELRHERFKAEITDRLVELYLDDAIVCVHDRLMPHDRLYSTIPEHMPASDDLIPWGETSGRSLRAWAKHIGFAAFQVVDALLKSATYEAQAFKSCTTLLSSAKKYGAENVNAACKEALKDRRNRLNLHWLTDTIKAQNTRKEDA